MINIKDKIIVSHRIIFPYRQQRLYNRHHHIWKTTIPHQHHQITCWRRQIQWWKAFLL